MSIPLLDLKQQYQSIKNEIDEAIHEVLDNQNFIMGQQVKDFEIMAAKYAGTEYAYGCASGSDALLLSLMASGFCGGDYVLTTPFTFFATGGAIARLGAIPIFLDIDPDSYNMDVNELESFMSGDHKALKIHGIKPSDIKAIIPVHLYGQISGMNKIMEIASKNELIVIEDAAQAMGALYDGKQAGSIGDFGCYSFFPSKNLGGYGDGGMVVCNDPVYADRVDIMRKHGAKPKYHHKVVGFNSRLDTLQAAVLSVKLKYLDGWASTRRQNAAKYNELFLQSGLTKEGLVITPKEVNGHNDSNRHVYHQYVIRSNKRDLIVDAFKEYEIGHSIYYPIPLHEQECFAYLNYKPEDCLEAHQASKEVVALPMFPELTDEQMEKVVSLIYDVVK